jgi:hypothetical protein
MNPKAEAPIRLVEVDVLLKAVGQICPMRRRSPRGGPWRAWS